MIIPTIPICIKFHALTNFILWIYSDSPEILYFMETSYIVLKNLFLTCPIEFHPNELICILNFNLELTVSTKDSDQHVTHMADCQKFIRFFAIGKDSDVRFIAQWIIWIPWFSRPNQNKLRNVFSKFNVVCSNSYTYGNGGYYHMWVIQCKTIQWFHRPPQMCLKLCTQQVPY